MPSLIVVLHHVGPLKPLSHVSLLLLSHLQAGGSKPNDSVPVGRSLWLVYIDQQDFEQRYEERRPLKRARLLEDLAAILRAKPAVLAIDLDLSPLALPSTDEEDSQQLLDTLLDNAPLPARQESPCPNPFESQPGPGLTTKVIVIDPLPASSEKLRDKKIKWWCDRRVAFADSDIEYPMNLAMEYRCNPRGLAELAYLALHGKLPDVCEKPDVRPISFGAYKQLTTERKASELAGLTLPPGSVVFFGSRAGAADQAVTPIGLEHGVVVHTAKFASFDRPLNHSHSWSFVMDLVFASGFSMGIAWFLKRYEQAATEAGLGGRAHRTVLLSILVAAYAFAIGLALAVAMLAIASRFEIVTEPLLIALGLALDGFVLAGWEHGHEAVADPHGHLAAASPGLFGRVRVWSKELDDVPPQTYYWVVIEVLRKLCFWAVLVFAAGFAFLHWS